MLTRSAAAVINKVFYRISSSSYVKGKLPGATKEVCLYNFLECFPKETVTLIADNCDDQLSELCNSTGCEVIKTSLGNARSFRKAVELALELPDDHRVYFVEDDYLHLTTNGYFESIPARDLAEGLLRADYATLYDHPDKYLMEYECGEITKTYRTMHAHWKRSISTTMTFAAKVSTLREDLEIWHKYTEGKHPEDHFIFTDLNKKGRTLAVRLPGTACHVDLTYYHSKTEFLGRPEHCHGYLEPWVFPLLESILAKKIYGKDDISVWDDYCPRSMPAFKRLMIIASLSNLVARNS
jgi:hypothetical protein